MRRLDRQSRHRSVPVSAEAPRATDEHPCVYDAGSADPPGPVGALGVPLTGARSLAVDPAFVPLGAPVWLATTWPNSTRTLQRLMLAQDTGGAIRGANRGDFFWGFGDEAAREAGRMRQSGEMWVLWPAAAGEPPR